MVKYINENFSKIITLIMQSVMNVCHSSKEVSHETNQFHESAKQPLAAIALLETAWANKTGPVQRKSEL